MSVRISHQVWQHTKTSGSDMLLLLAIADQANDQGVLWDKGVHLGTLATKARLKERACQYAITRLKEIGELYVRTAEGRGRASRYFVTTGMDLATISMVLHQVFELTPLEANTEAQAMLDRRKTVDTSASEKVQAIAPFTPENVHAHAPFPVEKVQAIAPFTPRTVQPTAPFIDERVQNPAQKGAKSDPQKLGFAASPSAKPDPIRHDSIDDDDGDHGTRLFRFLVNQGVGAAKEFVNHEPWADLLIADFQARRSDNQSIPIIVAAWRLAPPRTTADIYQPSPQEDPHVDRRYARSGSGSAYQPRPNAGRAAHNGRPAATHSGNGLSSYADKVAHITNVPLPEPADDEPA